MNQMTQHGFDYGQLAPMEAAEVRAASERIKIRMKRTAEDIVAIGQDLIATKQRLGHGQFGEWIRTEFDMAERTARSLMQVAERFGKSATVADMGLTTRVLYQLAAPSTPDEVVTRTIEAKQAGERVTTADVKKWKEEAQQAKQEAEAAKRAQQEADAKIADATARLEKAREEYIKLKNRPPERIEIEKVVEKIPEPYISLDQALQSRRNLMEDAEEAARKAKAEEERARREIERLKTELVKTQHEVERERNERSHHDDVRVKLASLKNGLVGLMKNYQEEFLVVGSDYLQHADAEMLRQVENHLRELADKIASVRGVAGEYAEFEVVSG